MKTGFISLCLKPLRNIHVLFQPILNQKSHEYCVRVAQSCTQNHGQCLACPCSPRHLAYVQVCRPRVCGYKPYATCLTRTRA
jgi:hypothetical protein